MGVSRGTVNARADIHVIHEVTASDAATCYPVPFFISYSVLSTLLANIQAYTDNPRRQRGTNRTDQAA